MINPIIAYFKNEDESLFLSQWNESQWKHSRFPLAPRVRDPFVSMNSKGLWQVLFTESWNSQQIGCSLSKDLIHWEEPSFPYVLFGAETCWAPEFLISDSGEFWYWSSKKGSHSAIWGKYLEKEPFVLFDPGYPVIDATIRFHDGKWEMAFKDERDEYKAIRIAHSKNLEGPYGEISEILTPKDTEGPIFYGDDILYDSYRTNSWGSTGKMILVPEDARHGSILV